MENTKTTKRAPNPIIVTYKQDQHIRVEEGTRQIGDTTPVKVYWEGSPADMVKALAVAKEGQAIIDMLNEWVTAGEPTINFDALFGDSDEVTLRDATKAYMAKAGGK